MPEYDDTNRGSLWANDKKTSENHPDYRGQANINGQEMWVSAWASDGSNPRAPVLRFAFTPKEAVAQQGIQQTRQATGIGVQPVQGEQQKMAPPPIPAYDASDVPF